MKGKVFKYGDDVDTDVIIPARYLTTSDPEVLKVHCMEDIDKEFAEKVSEGDIIVAGSNFGCGSSREHAPISIKAAGVSVVIAKSFARIFFRNAFNIGLPIMESAETAEKAEAGDELEVDLTAGKIKNITKNEEYSATPVPEFMQELVKDGGLIEHMKKKMAEGNLGKSGQSEQEKAKKEEKKEIEPGDRMKKIEEEAKASPEKAAPWGEDTGEVEKPPTLEEELERGEQDEEDD